MRVLVHVLVVVVAARSFLGLGRRWGFMWRGHRAGVYVAVSLGFSLVVVSSVGMRGSAVPEVQEQRQRAQVRCVDGPYGDPVASQPPVRLAYRASKWSGRVGKAYMIHIIDLHPVRHTMSKIGMIGQMAPRARKMPARTVKAVGTWYAAVVSMVGERVWWVEQASRSGVSVSQIKASRLLCVFLWIVVVWGRAIGSTSGGPRSVPSLAKFD